MSVFDTALTVSLRDLSVSLGKFPPSFSFLDLSRMDPDGYAAAEG